MTEPIALGRLAERRFDRRQHAMTGLEIGRRHVAQQPPQYFLAGKLRLIPSRREVTFDGAPFELTTCEFDLLEALLRSRDTVATKDDLSLSVLGRRREPYDRSIDVHVSNLRKKLCAVSARAIEIETVRAVGYRLRLAS